MIGYFEAITALEKAEQKLINLMTAFNYENQLSKT